MAKNEDLPLSAQWISKELLQETQELWSESYGWPISQDEAIEILFNVKRMEFRGHNTVFSPLPRAVNVGEGG